MDGIRVTEHHTFMSADIRTAMLHVTVIYMNTWHSGASLVTSE